MASKDALLRLATSLRGLVERSVALDAPDDLLAQASDEIDALSARLDPYTGKRPLPAWSRSVPSDDPNAFLPWSPVIGRLNPLAPPVELALRDGVVHGRVRFGTPYEGPPGCVHGAVVAAAFDQLLAIVNVANGQPAMTGTLTVRYRRPTPLHTELRFEAHMDRVEGRKVFAVSTLHAGDELVAEAEGIFIRIGA